MHTTTIFDNIVFLVSHKICDINLTKLETITVDDAQIYYLWICVTYMRRSTCE